LSNKPFFYNDGEVDEDEEEIDEDLDEEEEELGCEAVPSRQPLLIKFPRFVPHCDKKSPEEPIVDKHIVTMSDDEEDEAESRLQIDEAPVRT
jgi:hypothetical protein